MITEVELKYLILSEDASTKIEQLLSNHHISYEYNVRRLHNCYFDTPDLQLRQLDFGLRIRQYETHLEHTIKTAGKVIGGLHQRPEYNVNDSRNFPELTLFPTDIWPDQVNVGLIQSALTSLFSTNFERETWLVEMSGSKVEIALDQGEILSDGRSTVINELELELVEGEMSALYEIASILFTGLSLRAGIHSKAARGYRLFANASIEFEPELLFSDGHSTLTSQQWFTTALSHYLQQLQMCVEKYLTEKSLVALASVVELLSVIRHGFWLYDELLTEECIAVRQELSFFIQLFAWVESAIHLKEVMNKTGNYRKKLEYSQQLVEQLKLEKRRFPDFSMVCELLHSERFNQLQLRLLQLILSDIKPFTFVEQSEEQSLLPFARHCMSASLTELHQEMIAVDITDAEQLLAKRKILQRCLLTGNWFGHLFDQEHRHQFRIPWLDMQQGLSELQSLWIIKQQLEKLDKEDNASAVKVIAWQQRKVENLLVALSHTKDAALALPAYWQN
ncbi:inorganic triphosphatase [Thalassotalea sediminis]|uniref:CYTH domain-containing protein n=1 Tax=Thalassotalea sediminis TaxID=1759089 RepID=UPI002573C418|nr:CYTH domain-containing protein [Thalassotalea sediminis]